MLRLLLDILARYFAGSTIPGVAVRAIQCVAGLGCLTVAAKVLTAALISTGDLMSSIVFGLCVLVLVLIELFKPEKLRHHDKVVIATVQFVFMALYSLKLHQLEIAPGGGPVTLLDRMLHPPYPGLRTVTLTLLLFVLLELLLLIMARVGRDLAAEILAPQRPASRPGPREVDPAAESRKRAA